MVPIFRTTNLSHSYRILAITTLHKKPFLLSNIGFLFLNNNLLFRTTKYFYDKIMTKSRILKNQMSFFYKNDLKRIYLRRPGFAKLLASFTKVNPLSFFKQLKVPYLHFADTNSLKTDSFYNESTLSNRFFKKSVAKYRTLNFFPNFAKKLLTNNAIPIKRIRFKPGYQRIWRRARSALNFNLKLGFKYQAKLTKKVTFLRRLQGSRGMRFMELSLAKLILNVRFVFEYSTGLQVIQQNLTFLNGIQVTNPFLHLFCNDFLQLFITIKYYITYRWLNSWRRFNKTKFIKLLNYKNNSSRYDLSKQVSFSLPDWIFKYSFKNLDVPKYVELDFFTLSCFIIFEPTNLTQVNPLTFIESRSNIYTMYNWKYIN